MILNEECVCCLVSYGGMWRVSYKRTVLYIHSYMDNNENYTPTQQVYVQDKLYCLKVNTIFFSHITILLNLQITFVFITNDNQISYPGVHCLNFSNNTRKTYMHGFPLSNIHSNTTIQLCVSASCHCTYILIYFGFPYE